MSGVFTRLYERLGNQHYDGLSQEFFKTWLHCHCENLSNHGTEPCHHFQILAACRIFPQSAATICYRLNAPCVEYTV
jgi:hypothetical protein